MSAWEDPSLSPALRPTFEDVTGTGGGLDGDGGVLLISTAAANSASSCGAGIDTDSISSDGSGRVRYLGILLENSDKYPICGSGEGVAGAGGNFGTVLRPLLECVTRVGCGNNRDRFIILVGATANNCAARRWVGADANSMGDGHGGLLFLEVAVRVRSAFTVNVYSALLDTIAPFSVQPLNS